MRVANDAESYEAREQLVGFNQRTLLLVASTICRSVMEVSPSSVVGVQQASFTWSSYAGGDFHVLYDGIREATGKPSACRPGGGYHNDHAPREVFDKALDLAWGCTSLSYSAFMIPNERPAFYQPLFAGLAQWRGFLTGYARLNEGTRNSGAGIVLSRRHYRAGMAGRSPFAWTGFGGSVVVRLVSYGLPPAWQNEATPVLLLHPEAVDGLDDEELETISIPAGVGMLP